MSASTALVDPADLMQRASRMLAAGRIGAARTLIAAIRRIAPPSAAVAHLGARLAMSEGRLEDALTELGAAIAADPADVPLRKLRAELKLRLRDLPGAASDAAEAVVLQPADAASKALLGIVLLQLDHTADATACLAEAVRDSPGNPAFLQGLAAAQEAGGDLDGAAATLDSAIVSCPNVAALRSAAMLLAVRQNDPEGVIRAANAAQRSGAVDACVLGLKGHALSVLGHHAEAAEAYGEALKLAPEDSYVRHLVAASGVLPGAPRAPESYVKAVFDGYAEEFDAHIVSLGYRVPGLFRAALSRHLPQNETDRAVLDLGCGTGLAAVACADLLPGPWTGVDLSPRMLSESAAKGLYRELVEAEVADWLHRDERSWAVILAADVLCYFGDLAAPFTAVRQRLAGDGIFILSLEEADGDSPGWSLRREGRYAHTPGYLEAAARAAGLAIREADHQVLRRERGRPVAGLIAVLERAC